MANETTNLNAWEYRRISAANTTTLRAPLAIGDTAIYVTDVSKLPLPGPHLTRPGTVYINGEKITYYEVDVVNNALKRIRRGVWGTGVPLVHPLIDPLLPKDINDPTANRTRVVDASLDQLVPGDAMYSSWLDAGSYTPVKGNGLKAANTEQAIFLKDKPALLPHVPGYVVVRADPNSQNTRYDDDGDGQYQGTVHPYDIDPYDSYEAT